MLSSPVCVPSRSVPPVSPTLALSKARGTHLPASVVLCLALLPSLCVSGSGGLRGTQLDSGGATQRGAQSVPSAGKGTQTPEILNPLNPWF